MSDTTQLIVLIVSTILGLILGTFKDEIVNLFYSGRKYKHLKGKWNCRWMQNPGPANSQEIISNDTVEITEIWGKRVTGKGYAPEFGEWNFKGNISDMAIRLLYTAKEGTDRSGAIILKISPYDNNNLSGAWCQHKVIEIERDGSKMKSGEVVSGTTTWVKGH
ncbi:MAG: hypothetical protein WCF67_15025 [Chitinophagaceae bacterium]